MEKRLLKESSLHPEGQGMLATSVGLYHLPDNQFTPFVVWYRVRQEDGRITTGNGDYCRHVMEAEEAYEKKCQRIGVMP